MGALMFSVTLAKIKAYSLTLANPPDFGQAPTIISVWPAIPRASVLATTLYLVLENFRNLSIDV